MLIRLILEQHVKKVEESNLGQIPTLSLSSESSTLESLISESLTSESLTSESLISESSILKS